MHLFFAACANTTAGGLISSSNLPCAQATPDTLRTIFLVAFAIIGSLTLLFMVIGGARYVMSKGEPENIQKAKNEIKYSAIGLIIVALAAAIVNFILDKLNKP
jgi:cytochrome bd-type quinol oxidase subunit 2